MKDLHYNAGATILRTHNVSALIVLCVFCNNHAIDAQKVYTMLRNQKDLAKLAVKAGQPKSPDPF